MLERALVGASIDQEVLTCNKTRLGAAKIGTRVPEFGRNADSARGIAGTGLRQLFFVRLAEFLCLETNVVEQPIRFEVAGQETVDRDIVPDSLSREACYESGEAGAGTIRKAERGYRRLNGTRGDVDDAAPFPRDHAVDRRFDEKDGCYHVVVEGLEPRVLVPFAKIARRRAARIVHQDVGCRTCYECRGTPFVGGDVAGDHGHFASRLGADFGRRRLECLARSREDRDLSTFPR